MSPGASTLRTQKPFGVVRPCNTREPLFNKVFPIFIIGKWGLRWMGLGIQTNLSDVS
jgi:hypothetical protein